MKIPTVKAVLINKNSLVLKITVPGTTKYKFKSLEEKINPVQWDKKAGLCKKGHKNSESINTTIFTERNALISSFEADKANGVVFTAEHINNRLNGIEYNSKNFYEFAGSQIALKNYKESTRKNYRGEISKMKQYAETLNFKEINFSWLQGYENWMRTDRPGRPANHSNTVWKSLKFINTMAIQAIKVGGIIDKNPFKEYNRGKYKQNIPFYLEWSEVQAFHAALKEKDMPDIVRLCGYYFLLSCYSGLRWGDSITFDYKTQVMSKGGTKRLTLYAAKNNEIVSIAFNKFIAEVAEYLKDKTIDISNNDFNVNIVKVASIAQMGAKVVDNLSSHAGRHSFGMRCAELDISIERTQKLMGHIQQKSTSIYYRVKNVSLDSSMSKWE